MESIPPGPRSPWLVFGLSGQIGDALREAHGSGDPPLLALSRSAHPDAPGLRWLQGELPDAVPALAETPAAVLSLGPLDLFARWFEASPLRPARVVALGSTSVHGKQGSPDPAEQALVARLREAEERLARAADQRGSALTLLRPTLVWGRGRDHNLSRLVVLARRLGWLPLPRSARGLRQPVHADDVAAAALAALRAPEPRPGLFDLPGGETLTYEEMVARCLAAGAPGSRLLRLPGPLFRAGVRLARLAGRLGDAGEGVLARLDRDLVYDGGPARAALGWEPRPFRPDPGCFPDR
ncbi:MAG TPA: NAD-dependent epimerase/dehydratase family protein [Arenimonas sp.]|jgi:nucleoside-diphosphate-sugar epimerase|nr:NAD-dependent epimerase/dehydratase family protein [Arenimonas sp.]